MEILDRTSKEYKKNHGRMSIEAIHFNKDAVYISFKASNEYGIKEGTYAHFVIDMDRFYIYFDDDTIGFLVTKRSTRKNHGVCIRGVSLMKTLLDKLNSKVANGSEYPLRKCLSRINDSLTVEILFHKRL